MPKDNVAMNERPERIILDLAERLAKRANSLANDPLSNGIQTGGAGYSALFCNMAQLRSYHRDVGHRRLAERILKPLADKYSGSLFRFFTGDLLLLVEGVSEAKLKEAAERLFSLFAVDPIVADERTRVRFLRIYDLTREPKPFLALAQRLFEARSQHDEAQKNVERVREPEQAPGKPMDASDLVEVEKVLKTSDVEGLVTRQAICVINKDQPPQPTFDEIFVSVHRLQSAVIPGTDLMANPWLFQDLTRLLDQRLLSTLTRSRDSRMREAFSLNLNIETLTSEKFLTFDATHCNERNQSVLVELQMIDVLANLPELQRARPFLKDRRYRLCLDGLNHKTFLTIRSPRDLGFDFLKLHWTQEMGDLYRAKKLGDLQAAIQKVGPERVILAHCDSEEAVETGMAVGLMLFQGYHIDVLKSADLSMSAARTNAAPPATAEAH